MMRKLKLLFPWYNWILLVVLVILLSGCSNGLSGIVIGGAGGFVGPGAGGMKLVHPDPRQCGDLSASGSIPLSDVRLDCKVAADGSRQETIGLASADPTDILKTSFAVQQQLAQQNAQLMQLLLPMLERYAAQAAGTAALGPVGGLVAGGLFPPANPQPPLPPLLQGPQP